MLFLVAKTVTAIKSKDLAGIDCQKAGEFSDKRRDRIESFVKFKQYDPNLNLHEYADTLYADVGEVASTLIQLRYKQAEKAIEKLLK